MSERSLKRPKLDQENEESSPYHNEEEEEEERSEDDPTMTEEALILLLQKMEKEVCKYMSKIAHFELKVENVRKKINTTKKMLARLQSKKSEKPVLYIPPKIHSKSVLVSSSSSSDRNSVPKSSKHDFTHKNNTERNKQPRPLQEVNSDSFPKPSNLEFRQESNTGEYNLRCFSEEVNTSNIPKLLNFNPSNSFGSKHKRKLRCLELCPTDDTTFATSSLDGNINLWEVQSVNNKPRANLLYSFDFLSPKERKWPEDIAWHPQKKCIFSVHTAKENEAQVAMINITQTGAKKAVFLEGKPHVKGLINRITFMPWTNHAPRFTTCGSDHAVVLWKETDYNSWTHNLLHRDFHTSSVMAAFGLKNKEAVLSVGMDKRVVLYDLVTQRSDFKFLLDASCLNLLPNPVDSNLYMVKLGVPEKQLRLFDMREKQKELHVFGWKQNHSDSQSAHVSPAWSPDGWHVSSGSADNSIHLFDIRYKSNVPSQSLKAHSKSVLKAVWHPTLHLLISISSDTSIGLHSYH